MASYATAAEAQQAAKAKLATKRTVVISDLRNGIDKIARKHGVDTRDSSGYYHPKAPHNQVFNRLGR